MFQLNKVPVKTIKKADIRFRLRVFSYLKENNIPTVQANRVAHKIMLSMVNGKVLPAAVVKLAAAAISEPSKGDIKIFGLLEPKAEPREFSLSSKVDKQGNQQPNPNPGPQTPQGKGGGVSNWAIIEPVIFRREVSSLIGRSLSRNQVQLQVRMIGFNKTIN